MFLKSWDELPINMRSDEVRKYYDALKAKTGSLILKRTFDIIVSGILLILLFPVFLFVSIVIRVDSAGPVFFRQTRVTQYGKVFRIFKFRTMVINAGELGAQVTQQKDTRITRVGRHIRNCRLDEIPQLIDVLRGTMTFVGARPEVPQYVACYTPEMMATLLLPSGITSEASIQFKDESRLLSLANDQSEVYIKEILPAKMRCNLKSLLEYSFFAEIKTMIRTVLSVCGKNDVVQ